MDGRIQIDLDVACNPLLFLHLCCAEKCYSDFPVFVLFSVTVVSLPSNYIFISTDSVDVSVLLGNWCLCVI
jgi:hypothetical protein